MAWSLNNYETYIYSVQTLSPHIQASNLVLIRRGKFLADVEGNISFAADIVLEVYEHLNFVCIERAKSAFPDTRNRKLILYASTAK